VYLCNDEKIAEYVKEVRKIEKSFDGFEGSFSTERDLLHGVLLLVERQWPPQPIDATSSKAASALLHPGGESSIRRHGLLGY
jgi:hypothetical protein